MGSSSSSHRLRNPGLLRDLAPPHGVNASRTRLMPATDRRALSVSVIVCHQTVNDSLVMWCVDEPYALMECRPQRDRLDRQLPQHAATGSTRRTVPPAREAAIAASLSNTNPGSPPRRRSRGRYGQWLAKCSRVACRSGGPDRDWLHLKPLEWLLGREAPIQTSIALQRGTAALPIRQGCTRRGSAHSRARRSADRPGP
jgi:hypothetical protein